MDGKRKPIVTNGQVANHLLHIATMLSLVGQPIYKVQSFQRAADQVLLLDGPIEQYVTTGTVETISGVGQSIAEVIASFVKNGSSQIYLELVNKVPHGYPELLQVQGLGRKTIMQLYHELRIQTLDELEVACAHHRLQMISGIGPKTEMKIALGIQHLRKSQNRFLLGRILPFAEKILHWLKTCDGVQRAAIVGSVRRMRETVHNINILLQADDSDFERIFVYFSNIPWVLQTAIQEPFYRKVTMQLGHSEVPVDLRIVSADVWGVALLQYTGSTEHVYQIVERIHDIVRSESFQTDIMQVAQREEQTLYSYLNLAWIAPELRENRGELNAAEIEGAQSFPELVTTADIKGDLHVHSNWSDGARSIREMAEYARSIGYTYIAITDHSRSLSIARGLSIEQIRRQREEIKRLNSRYEDFHVFAGIEMDILPDGSLDYPDDVLQELDFVIASIHSSFQLSMDKQTERLVSAMQNPFVHMIGHPSGRLLSRRPGYPLDWERVFEAAVKTHTILEINGSPNRLDLSDLHAKKATELGVRIAVNTDAHAYEEYHYMRYGVATARRAWLSKHQVVNAYDVESLKQILQLKRELHGVKR